MNLRFPVSASVLFLILSFFSPTIQAQSISGPTIQDALSWDTCWVDLSTLQDKPAGQHGFVQVKGDSLVFEDGTPARFWGCNIAASALFGSKDDLQKQAKRIAALGFNLVRIHHQDSMSWVKPCIIETDRNDSKTLNMGMVDRLEYFIHCLKQEGVYIYYDLHVGRKFKSGDGISLFSETKGTGKAFWYIDSQIEKLMMDHTREVITHINPYTGKSMVQDPAVVIFMITNEDDLAGNGGNTFLPDKGRPQYTKKFMAHVERLSQKFGLSKDAAWKTWLAGPSKIVLAELEKEAYGRWRSFLSGLNVKIPLIGTNWAYNGLYQLPGPASLDIIDNHVYDGGPNFLKSNPVTSADWRMRVAQAHVAGKPFSISEWNIVPEKRGSAKGYYRAAAVLAFAAMGGHQGWDATMIYNYRQSQSGNVRYLSQFCSLLDPALMGPMPAAALMFRRDITESPTTTILLADKQQIYYNQNNAKNMAGLRTNIEQTKTTVGLESVPSGLGQTRTAKLDENALAGANGEVSSDTKEIRRSWSQGIQWIDTPCSQVLSGDIGGKDTGVSGLKAQIKTPFAVTAASSLDGKPLPQSSHILITALSLCNSNSPKYTSQIVEGTILLKRDHEASSLSIIPVTGRGVKSQPRPLSAPENGWITIELGADKTHWFILASSDIPADQIGKAVKIKALKIKNTVSEKENKQDSEKEEPKIDNKKLDKIREGMKTQLHKEVLKRLKEGQSPMFHMAMMKQDVEISTLDEEGNMTVNSQGLKMPMKWDTITIPECASLAIDLAGKNNQKFHAVAAFFLFDSEQNDKAETHLMKAGKAGAAVRKLFK